MANLLNEALTKFWLRVHALQSAMGSLHAALEQAASRSSVHGEAVPDYVVAAEEKARSISSVLQERIHAHDAITPFMADQGLDPSESDRNRALDLMTTIQQNWMSLAESLESVEENSVIRAWKAAQTEWASLLDRREEVERAEG